MPKFPVSEDLILHSGSSIENLKAGVNVGEAIAGVLRYVSVSNDYQFYNGNKWVSMSGFLSSTLHADNVSTGVVAILNGLSADGTTYEFRSLKAGSNKITIIKNAAGQIEIDLGSVPISAITDLQTKLNEKVDKITGKGLSANDFTNDLKTKLEGIATAAEVNVQADWTQTDANSDAFVKNKPTFEIVEDSTPTSGYAKTYRLKQTIGNTASDLGVPINIPKDLVLQSGSVKSVTQVNVPYAGAVVGDLYIDLLLANSDNTHIYIPANALVENYTALNSAGNEVVIVVSADRKISAALKDGSIAKTKLNTALVQEINGKLSEKLTLGTITASETEVAITELPVLSILQRYASNIKAMLSWKTLLGLEKTYVSGAITGQSGTITKSIHGVNNPKIVTATINGVNMIIYTAINQTTKDITWSSKTNFIASDNVRITIIG